MTAISRIRLPALVLAVAACGGNVNVVRQQKLELQNVNLPLRTFAFPSGLRVVVEKDTRTPLAGVFVVVGSGSSSDPKGKEGLAHYVEHLAFQSRPFGKESFRDMLEAAGAIQWNASTDPDATTYFEIGPAAALPQLLRTEAVRMVIPVSDIADSARAIELDVVRNELRERNETGFNGEVFPRLQSALFPPGHPNASPIGGTQQSLSALTNADVVAFAKAHYRPDNMTLVVLGNLDLDKAGDLLADTLPEALVAAPQPVKLPQRLAAVPPPVPDPPPRPARLPKVEAPVAAPELWIGWSMPRGFDRDGYLLSFLANAARSRFLRLRLDDRDITSIDVFPVGGKDASMLLCRVSLNEAKAPEKTLDSVLGEAPKVVNGFLRDPDDENLRTVMGNRYTFGEVAYARLRRTTLVYEILGMEDLVRRGQRRALVTHFAEDPTVLSRALHDLVAVTPERFADYASPYLTSERARAVLFVPNGGGTRLAAASGGAGSAERERKSETLPPPPKAWVTELLANPGEVKSTRLQNGLSVVLVRRPGLPLLSASIAIGVGPSAAKDAGARAFARAMAFPATELNDPAEYGGITSDRETPDSIIHVVDGPSGNAEAILATLAEKVRTMHLEPRSEMHYKESVLPSYERRERDPHRRADRAFLSSVLPGSPYGHVSEYGELENVSEGAASEWIDRTHVPSNARLVVVGDFDPKQIQGFVEDSFGGWKGDAAPAAAKLSRAEAKDPAVRTVTTARPGATQGEIRFGCQLPDISAGAIAVRHELAAVLARDRLERILRDSLGASYGVHGRTVELADGTAYLDLRTDVENAKLPAALRELHDLVDRLAAKPMDDQTLEWARYAESSGVALSQMSNEEVATSILRRTRIGLSPDLGEVARDLASVSAKDVQGDFQQCLKAHPTLSIVGEESVVQAAVKEGWTPTFSMR
ncbi:MAG: M16 family metallopeptidase [Myxococcales bacterium]